MAPPILRVLSVVSVLLFYTSMKAIQIWPSHWGLAVACAVVLFVFMVGGILISRMKPDAYEDTWFRIFVWVGSLGMACWATFVIFSIPLDFLQFAIDLPQGIVASTLAVSGALATLGFIQVVRGPKVKKVEVRIENLSPSLRGLRIAQISDLHVGPTIRKRYVVDVVNGTNATEPDLILITGDIADGQADSISENLEPLRNLRARLGKFYVTGNHEYYSGAQGLIDKLVELGFTPLLNENRVVQVGDAKVLVAGVTDPMGAAFSVEHRPDLKKAVRSGVVTQLKLLLAHRPDVCDQAEPLGVDLQFSGHTHAGQFFPFSLFIGLAHKYSRGLYRHGRMSVYVNPGTGYWGPANRLGVTPEISLITLNY